jgi:hypothetical protein
MESSLHTSSWGLTVSYINASPPTATTQNRPSIPFRYSDSLREREMRTASKLRGHAGTATCIAFFGVTPLVNVAWPIHVP